MNISYIRVLNAIELFSKEHMQVKRFASDFPAQIPNFGTETEQYPILFVSPSTSVLGMNITTFTIDVYCFDIIQKDRANINTILSDTHLILSDLNRWILDGDPAGFDIIDTEPNLVPIDNALLDYAAGWRMTLTIDCETYGVCEIPFKNMPIISEIYNDIIYPTVLTCETLEDCQVIQDIQYQISNIDMSGYSKLTGGNTFSSNQVFLDNVIVNNDFGYGNEVKIGNDHPFSFLKIDTSSVINPGSFYTGMLIEDTGDYSNQISVSLSSFEAENFGNPTFVIDGGGYSQNGTNILRAYNGMVYMNKDTTFREAVRFNGSPLVDFTGANVVGLPPQPAIPPQLNLLPYKRLTEYGVTYSVWRGDGDPNNPADYIINPITRMPIIFPPANAAGLTFIIKNSGTQSITMSAIHSTIDGQATRVIGPGINYQLVSNGLGDWLLLT